MYTNDKKIHLSSFVFESNDTEVLINGTVSQGAMSFETELIISQTQLNMVMNQLKKQNSDFELSDHLTSAPNGPDTEIYFAQFDGLQNSLVDLSSTQNSLSIRQIRA